MTRMQHWTKLLKKQGYSIEYKEYSYHNVPFAVKDGSEIMLGFEENTRGWFTIVTIKDIVANEDNFASLKCGVYGSLDFGERFEPVYVNNSVKTFAWRAYYHCNKCGLRTAKLKMNSVAEFWIECTCCGAKTEKIHSNGRTDTSAINELRCIWTKTDFSSKD